MKILVVNEAVHFDSVGDEVEYVSGVGWHHRELYSMEPISFHDYDAFVLDLETLPNLPAATLECSEFLSQAVDGGAFLLCFIKDFDFKMLPGSFESRSNEGREVVITGDASWRDFLSSFARSFYYRTVITKGRYEPLMTTKAGATVGCITPGNGILLLPQCSRKEEFCQQLFDRIVPQLIPERAGPRLPVEIKPPEWVSELTYDVVKAKNEDLASLRARIRELEATAVALQTERDILAEYEGLLWLRGKRELEPLVRKALTYLGVPVSEEPPVDAIFRSGDTVLYAEIEGSDNAIAVDKGRQLLGYISQAPNPASVLGAVIGNPFRLFHPDKRPPDSKWSLFSPELTKISERFGWSLITTYQIYQLVGRKMAGEPKEAERRMRELLNLPME